MIKSYTSPPVRVVAVLTLVLPHELDGDFTPVYILVAGGTILRFQYKVPVACRCFVTHITGNRQVAPGQREFRGVVHFNCECRHFKTIHSMTIGTVPHLIFDRELSLMIVLVTVCA